MKTLSFRELYKIFALLAIVLVLGTSCNDEDDPVLPDYAGTWVAVESVLNDSGTYIQVKDIMTFTETSFTNTGQWEVMDKWTDIVSMKGSMMVTGDIMTVTITEIGVTSLDGISGLPTGVITSYKKGTSQFNVLLAETEQEGTFESKYTVSGNKLTLQTDHNGDNDYLDEMETTVYTKQ